MSTAIKHKMRSSRKYQANIIPIGMFASRAERKRQAKEMKEIIKNKTQAKVEEVPVP